MLLIMCCLIVTDSALSLAGRWNAIAVGSCVAGGLILLGLVVRIVVALVKDKELKTMSAKPLIIVDTCNSLLFLYWLYSVAGAMVAVVWLILMLWTAIRRIRRR